MKKINTSTIQVRTYLDELPEGDAAVAFGLDEAEHVVGETGLPVVDDVVEELVLRLLVE